MKKMCTTISTMLCVTLVLFMFAGCSGNSTGKSTEDATNSTPSSEYKYTGSAPISEEPLTISWLCTNNSTEQYDFKNMAWVQEILKHANVKLDIELIDSSAYSDSVSPRLAAGIDLPDVVYVINKDTDMSYINAGLFIELTDLYNNYGYNIKTAYKNTPLVKSQLTTHDGKMYYVPAIDFTSDYCTALSINAQWLNKVSMDKPTTTDEYYKVLKAFKEADINGNGKDDEVPAFMRLHLLKMMSAMWGIDLTRGYFINENGKAECSYASEKYLEFLSYWNKMFKEKLLNNDFATTNSDIQTNLFSNNLIGSLYHYHDNNTDYSKLIYTEFDLNSDPLIMVALDPLTGPFGDKQYWGNDPLMQVFGITRDCKNPEAVFYFIDYLFSEEANTLLYFGTEGDVYNMVDGKMVIDLEKWNADSYANKMGNNFGGFPREYQARHRNLTRIPELVDVNIRLKPFYKAPIVTSYYLPEELNTIQAYAADLKTYWSEMFISFITGTTDLTQFNSYVETLKSMHVDDVTAVYQAKYDRMNP
jgi:putative aldouronate transport system substrate-binding protein